MPETFEFTILLDPTEEPDAVVDRLYEAGCSDATLAVRSGSPCLTFSREADTLKDALFSAIRQIKQAGLSATRIEMCDLVSEKEIAQRLRLPLRIVREYISGQRGPGSFPPPVCPESECGQFWYWCEVAEWAYRNQLLSKQKRDEALLLEAVNRILENRVRQKQAPDILEEIQAL